MPTFTDPVIPPPVDGGRSTTYAELPEGGSAAAREEGASTRTNYDSLEPAAEQSDQGSLDAARSETADGSQAIAAAAQSSVTYGFDSFVEAAGGFITGPPSSTATSGYAQGDSAQRYSGAAHYIQDEAVDAAFVALWPRSSFIDGDGRGWRLDIIEATPEMFGAKGDGTTDDSDAVREAIFWCGGRDISLRLLGSYLVNEQIDYTGSLTLLGAVPQQSNLLFGAGGNLILRIPNAQEYGGAFFLIKRIGLFAKTLNTGAGLRIIGALNAAGSTHRTIDMENVDISGVDGMSSFRDGVWITDGRNSTFRSIRIQGDRGTPPPWQALTGFRIDGLTSSTELSFKECKVFFCVKAVQGRGNSEGVRFHDCVFVAVYDGLDVDMNPQVPLWCFDYGHLNVIRTMIKFRGVSQFSISGNEFYVTNASGDFTGLDLDISSPAEAAAQIFGNAILRIDAPAMNPGATYTAIRLNSTVGVGTFLVDLNNILPNWDIGIHLMPNCQQALIGRSNRITSVIPVINQGQGNSVFDALPIVGLTANSSTPRLEQFYDTYFTQNTSNLTVTRFTNYESGKPFTVLVRDNFTTFQHNANLLMARGRNFKPENGCVIVFKAEGSVVREVSRSTGVNIFRNAISTDNRAMFAGSGNALLLGYDDLGSTPSENVLLGPNMLPRVPGQGQIGDASQRFDVMAADLGDFTSVTLGGGIKIMTGSGDPNGVVSAPNGSFYIRTQGGGWYHKQPGTANSPWVVR